MSGGMCLSYPRQCFLTAGKVPIQQLQLHKPNQILLLDKGQEKSDPRWPLHRQAWIKKKEIRISQNVVTRSQQINACTMKNTPFYLGHLDHVGKLCQTGDGDHIMVGFQLVPGEVIKHSVWFQSHIMWCNISQKLSDGKEMIRYRPSSNFPTLACPPCLPPSQPSRWPK